MHLGKIDDADRDLAQLSALRGIPASVWIDYATLRLLQKRPDEAARMAEGAIAQEPQMTDAWRQLARAQFATGSFDRAQETLLRGSAVAAQPADLFYELAAMRAQRGDTNGARQAADEALARVGTTAPTWEDDARRLATSP